VGKIHLLKVGNSTPLLTPFIEKFILDELRERIKEAIELYLEVESDLIHEMPLNFAS